MPNENMNYFNNNELEKINNISMMYDIISTLPCIHIIESFDTDDQELKRELNTVSNKGKKLCA